MGGQCWIGPQSGCLQGVSSPVAPTEGGILQRQVVQTITFFPSADTQVAHDTVHDTCNYGACDMLIAGVAGANSVYRGLINFALDLPPGFQVANATLGVQTLYWRGSATLADVTVNVHAIDQSWLEGSGGPLINNGGLLVTWASPAATQMATQAAPAAAQAQGFTFQVNANHTLESVMVQMDASWTAAQWVAQLLVSPTGGPVVGVPFTSLTAVQSVEAAGSGHWAQFQFQVRLQPNVPYALMVSFVAPSAPLLPTTDNILTPIYPLLNIAPCACVNTATDTVQAATTSLMAKVTFVLAPVAAMCGTTDGATGLTRGPGVLWADEGLGFNGIDASTQPVATATKQLTKLTTDDLFSWALNLPGAYAYTPPSAWMDPDNSDLSNSYYPQDINFFKFSWWTFDVTTTVQNWYTQPVASDNGFLLVNALDQPLGIGAALDQLPAYPAFSSREGILPAILSVTIILPQSATCPCGPFYVDPWSLNVFVANNVGSAIQPRGAEIQGALAVGGSLWAQAFTVNDQNNYTQQGIALYAGGDVNFTGGQVFSGGMAVGGNVLLMQTGVEGVVLSGGTVSGAGLVTKSVSAAGAVTFPATDALGGVQSGVPYTPSLDLVALAAYYQCYSTDLQGLPNSVATFTTEQNGGIIDVQVMTTGRAVVTIPAATLAAAYQIVLWGPTLAPGQSAVSPSAVSPAELIINVPDQSVVLNAISWIYLGLAPGKVVLNLPNAQDLYISGATHEVVLLAPWATVDFPYGRINGQLVCGSLVGGDGQFSDGFVNGLNMTFSQCVTSRQCTCNDGIQNNNEQGVDCGDPECGCPSCGNCNCGTFPIDPWALNVAVFGDIGSASLPRGADYDGAAAATGNVWYKSFSVNFDAHNAVGPISHYVGGTLSWDGGQVYHGGLEVHGNVNLSGVGVAGSVLTGGSLGGIGGGAITGNVETAGQCSWCTQPGSSVSGATVAPAPFQESLDLPQLQTYFMCVSNQLAQSVNNPTAGAQVTNQYGHLYISLVAGQRNFVTIAAGLLLSAWQITIQGTATSELIINVPDTVVILNTLVWDYQGVLEGKVLLNMAFATTVTVTSGPHTVVFLAPWAVLDFPQGVIEGNVIVGQLMGGNGQIGDSLRNTMSLPCLGQACSCPNLRNLSCRPCVPGQDAMCTSLVPNVPLCQACNGQYGANCWPFDCFCPESGTSPPTQSGATPAAVGTGTCLPCTSADVGCAYAGVATAAWCQAVCQDGQYTATCTPAYCTCGATTFSVPTQGGAAPSPTSTSYVVAPQFLTPCFPNAGTNQSFCNQECLEGAFYTSTCTSALCQCPLGTVPSCTACSGPGCSMTATDTWCQQNCLASLYYGGACLPAYCTCGAGWASVEITLLMAGNPTMSLADVIWGLMQMTNSSAVNVIRILPLTGGPAPNRRAADTPPPQFAVTLQLQPTTWGLSSPAAVAATLQALQQVLGATQGHSLTFGNQTVTVMSVQGSNATSVPGSTTVIVSPVDPSPTVLFPGIPGVSPVDGSQPAPTESMSSGGVVLAVAAVCAGISLVALALSLFVLLRWRQQKLRDQKKAASDDDVWSGAPAPSKDGAKVGLLLELDPRPQPISPPSTALDPDDADPFPAVTKAL